MRAREGGAGVVSGAGVNGGGREIGDGFGLRLAGGEKEEDGEPTTHACIEAGGGVGVKKMICLARGVGGRVALRADR